MNYHTRTELPQDSKVRNTVMRSGMLGQDRGLINENRGPKQVQPSAPPLHLAPETMFSEYRQDHRDLGPPPSYEEATSGDPISRRGNSLEQDCESSSSTVTPSRPSSSISRSARPKKKGGLIKRTLGNFAFFLIELID